MTKAIATEDRNGVACPKCSGSFIRDFKRTPVLMGIWLGCIAAIAVLAFPFDIWLVFVCAAVVAGSVGWLFCRAARRYAAQYECKICHTRWRKAEPDAPNPAIAPWMDVGRPWHRVGDPER